MIARKEHKCYWCGEKIASGDKLEVLATPFTLRDGTKTTVRHRYHPECRDAKDQATLHGFSEVAEGRCERGEYPCPNDTDGDGDCQLCCDTPYRRFARGDNKPALVAARALEDVYNISDRALNALRKAGL